MFPACQLWNVLKVILKLSRMGPHAMWSPAPQLRAQMQATTAVAVGLPCHIHLHARAPLIVASAPLHAGNKAHRKCTQSECSALHCCHSFCPQGDHSSVQQPCRPLLLREHPDLQQCSGDKNVTCGPGAWQAVSTFPTSPPSLPPGPPGKGFRGLCRVPCKGTSLLNQEKLSFRTGEVEEAQAWMLFPGTGLGGVGNVSRGADMKLMLLCFFV